MSEQKQAVASGQTGAATSPCLRVGVVGLGIGRAHIEGWRQHPRVEVVTIADPDPARLQAVGTQFGITARHASAAAMLAAGELDVVSICTPNKFHKALTLAALEAGCHVLCEKPMALNAAEGRVMLTAAKNAGKRLMINFSYRFSAASRGLKAQVDSGMFGEFYFGHTVWHRRRGIPGFGGWFGDKALSGGGPLIDLGVHRLDLALWLMGYPKPTWVLGSTHDPIARDLAAKSGKTFDIEDLASALIRFDSGATLVLEASWAANIQEAELMETRLLGTRAGLLQKNPGREGDRYSRAVAAGNRSGRGRRANARVQARLQVALAIRTATGQGVCPRGARGALARELARTGAQPRRAWLGSTGAHRAAHRDAQADAPRASLSGVAHWLSAFHAGVDRLDRGGPAKRHQRLCVVARARQSQRLGPAPRRPVAVRVAGVRGRELRHLGPRRVLRLAVPIRRPAGAFG